MDKWILWQRACDETRAEILKEVRALHKNKAVTTHKEMDDLICEVYNPILPAEYTKNQRPEGVLVPVDVLMFLKGAGPLNGK